MGSVVAFVVGKVADHIGNHGFCELNLVLT